MRIHERMTKTVLMGYTIRVWEEVATEGPYVGRLAMGPNHEITVALRAAVTGKEGNYRVTPDGIGAVLEMMTTIKLNAYEIVDPLGNGCVVYPIWP